MTTTMYIIWKWNNKDIVNSRPNQPHIEVEVWYYLRDKWLTCETEKVQEVISEILAVNKEKW